MLWVQRLNDKGHLLVLTLLDLLLRLLITQKKIYMSSECILVSEQVSNIYKILNKYSRTILEKSVPVHVNCYFLLYEIHFKLVIRF